VAALGPNYDDGDVEEQINALIDGWRNEGRIPINGREVEFYLRSYDILSPEAKRAACKGWSRDDKVVAVFTVHNFFDAIECLPREEKVPLVATDYAFESVEASSRPYLFLTMPSVDSMWRNWIHWMDDNDLLEGSRIGLYYADGPGRREVVDATIKAELTRLGHGDKLVAEVTTDNDGTGSSQEQVAVQRFRTERVDLALLLISAIGQTNFMQSAEVQGYRPRYVANDWYTTTNDAAASTFPASQYDGTLGMTSVRFGERNSGLPLTPEATACIDNYERYSGRRVTWQERPAEWMALLQGCDAGTLLLEALERAGNDVTRDSVVTALDATQNRPLALHANVTWSRDYHHGPQLQRTLKWQADCACWRVEGDFAPFYVP